MLATKLFAPPLRTDLVVRQRLVDRLDAGLRRKLTLVSAPAGYGKTTLVSSWLHETRLPSAWLSLDDDDNDPVRFFQYLIAALQRMVQGRGEGWVETPQGGQPAAFESTFHFLLNELAGHGDPCVLVLDDFHVLHSRPVLDTITYLLEHMPLQLHLVLLSRADPAFPLARLRVLDQLVEVRAEHLRFTSDETSVLLNDRMHLNLSASDLAVMEARTEGWIASLQLAGLSMQSSPDIHAFVSAFAGSHHYVMDYLVEEVLSVQPENVRSFLLHTSILDRMSAALCDAVNETGEAGGQEMLQALEQRNLFVVPLDNARIWYRYHHLFADVLHMRLEHLFPHKVAGLHLRASRWYEQNGFLTEAIQHALAAGDLERTVRLIEQYGCLLLIRGEIGTLRKWIEAVELRAASRPWIQIFKSWIFALTGQPGRVDEPLQAAEQQILSLGPSAETSVMLGAIAAARAYQANLQGETLAATQRARQALRHLPDVDLVSRSLRTVATSLLGDACTTNGDLEEAMQAYTEAMQIARAAGDIHLTVVLNSNIANLLVEQGRLHEAHGIYSETLAMATRPDGQWLVIAGRPFVELGLVSYEWNRQEDARQQIQQGIALCRQWGNVDQQAIGTAMLAWLEHARGRPGQTQEALQVAERLLEEHNLLSRNAAWVRYALARLWIDRGEVERARSLIRQGDIKIEDEISYLREPEYLVMMRILLTQGDTEPGLHLCRRMLPRAQAARRNRRVIEILVLQALLYQRCKDVDRALQALGRALGLARPEGWVRTFVDEGEPMAKLLHLARARQMETDYAADLLSAMVETRAGGRSLAEPLTQRELEVLRLMQSGCSNHEIAGRLVISIATVKRHISNTYAKLNARNRVQAVSIGKELGLFD